MNKSLSMTKNLLLENCNTFIERDEVHQLTEAELKHVSSELVTQMYTALIEKSHVNFDKIPTSMGRIEKYVGTVNMLKTLDIISQVAEKMNVKVPEIEVVNVSITNISNMSNVFEAGFKTGNELVTVTYNTLVMACVEATSAILSSYVEFVKSPNGGTEVSITKSPEKVGTLVINNLALFNGLCKNGEFQKTMTQAISSARRNFGGFTPGDVMNYVSMGTGAMMSLLPALRQMTYMYYNSKLKVSHWCDQQAQFIEANRLNIESNTGLDPAKKATLIQKQSKEAARFLKLADIFKVDTKTNSVKTLKEIDKENSNWTLGNLKSSAGNRDINGLELF